MTSQSREPTSNVVAAEELATNVLSQLHSGSLFSCLHDAIDEASWRSPLFDSEYACSIFSVPAVGRLWEIS